MVVEDERVVAKDLEETLVRLGYEVVATTASGEECLRLAPAGKPDLVLMDIRIKGKLDGIETAAQLKAQLDVPVVYLTAYADEETLARARCTEAHGYLLKPFRAGELKSSIEIALAKHQADQKLKTRERWFSTTLRALGDAVIAVDPELRVSFANPVAEELTGVGADLTGRRLNEVFRLINARTRQPLKDPVQEVLTARVPSRLPAGALLVRGDETVPIEDSVAPILDDRGDLLGAVLVFRDAREQEALREQIAASDRLASLGTLAAGVAHEINNPLTYIAANANSMTRQLAAVHEMVSAPHEYSDLVCDPLEVLASLQQEVTEIEEGAERIRRIVADLGVFARPDLSPGKGDVLHALQWALRVTESTIKQRAALSLGLGATPKVHGDVTRIGQILINLLVNAAQAIPEGNPEEHQVFVSTAIDRGGVVVSVRDTGCGMTPDVMRRIFDPFFTTKPPGSGTGLGLSVCARLVEAMGGALTVSS
ncbi:MAG TPA: response regulator, partial [Polyangiaceae bacterium]